jgi:ABC-type multidrug transport system ATPase subunit
MTAQSGLAAVLMVMTTREELQGLVAKIVRSGFYGGKSHMVLADELISMAMERGYNGEGIEDFFEDLGYENRKVIEFIKIFSDNKSFDIEKIKRFCDILDLDKNVLSKKISSLSKGMSQKVGLIASFIDNKKLVILDEPMSGLDPKARINLKNLLLEYKNNGNSIFFSSHILADIDEICDRIAVLHGGKIQFVGTPSELKSRCGIDSLEKAFLREIEG